MTLYKWSQTASTDATADSTINWSEGQAPSSINDSARAMMAATAKYRDDISGAIVTSGTSVAYAIASYQQFDTLAHLNGQMVAFTPHTTNGATVTLNVDSLGAKPLRSAPNAELLPGTIIQGTPYVATYNQVDAAFYLRGVYGNPYNIPLAASLDYWANTAPNSAFAFPYGQAISRTTYATLFALVGTTFGTGDGSTTFNLPDLRGRVVASPDNMGGSDASLLAGSSALAANRFTLGAKGGESGHALSLSEIPTITSIQNGISITVSPNGGGNLAHTSSTVSAFGTSGGNAAAATANSGAWDAISSLIGSINVSVVSQGTGGTAHNVVQPTILGNRILRII